jgi:hypothetical protein
MSGSPRVFVITCPIPPGSARDVRVEIADRTAVAVTPRGFRHRFELPPDVAIEGLEWQVYGDVLELRAPYRGGEA